MPYKEGEKWRGKVQIAGKRYTRWFDTRREALDWETEARREVKQRTRIGMDLADMCNEYLDYAAERYTKKTFAEKRALSDRLLEFTGNMPAGSVMPDMLLKYLRQQLQDRSPNAYNKDRKNLLAMFNHAVQFLGLPRNPMARIRRIPHDRVMQYVPPTEDVLKLLASATREERVLLDCYLNTGARRCEIFRWTWVDDINFEQRKVRLGTRKNRDGSLAYEWIDMNDVLHESLRWWWQNRPIKKSPYVFVSTFEGRWYGKPFTVRRKFMHGLCDRAKIKPFGFHSLRRYVASYLSDTCKVSTKTIQRILRHRSINTTERYIRRLNDDMRGAYAMLGDMYREGSGPGLCLATCPQQEGTQGKQEYGQANLPNTDQDKPSAECG